MLLPAMLVPAPRLVQRLVSLAGRLSHLVRPMERDMQSRRDTTTPMCSVCTLRETRFRVLRPQGKLIRLLRRTLRGQMPSLRPVHIPRRLHLRLLLLNSGVGIGHACYPGSATVIRGARFGLLLELLNRIRVRRVHLPQSMTAVWVIGSRVYR